MAPQVTDTAKHDAVKSNWMDRTDIAVGVQTGGQSKLDKGHFLTDDWILFIISNLIMVI